MNRKTATAAVAVIAAAFSLPGAAQASAPPCIIPASAPGYVLTTTGADYSALYLSRSAETTRQDFTAVPAGPGTVMLEWTPEGRRTGLVATAEGARVVLALADMADPRNLWKVRGGGVLASEAGGVLTATGVKVDVARARGGKAQSWTIR